jgi:tight adherence protein C
MDNVIRMLSGLSTSPAVLQAMVLGAAFVAAAALIAGVWYLVASRTNLVKDRLQRTVVSASSLLVEPVAAMPPPEPGADRSTMFRLALSGVSRLAQPRNEEELGRLRGKLSHAGYRSEVALAVYLIAKIIFSAGLGGLFLWYNATRSTPVEFSSVITIVLMIVGFYLPAYWLHGQVQKRQTRINRALPDALDLVVTCVEGGLGLDAALNRVSDELYLSAPILATEFAQTSLEMRAGMSRSDSFRRLASRTGVEELRNLAAVIIQTEIFGTSIARSLRIMAEAIRIRRTQRAEERAAMVGVKLTVPLIFCIMPALFAVLMGPAAVRIIRVLLPTLGGGN